MPNPTPPSRRDVHAAILWCARWRLGDGEQYLGPITVEITAKRKGEKIIVQPRNRSDGLTLPPGLGVPPCASVSALELLKVFLSCDERAILVAAVRNPKSLVKELEKATKITGSKFFSLWANLKARGLVAKAEHGEGFTILVNWLAPLLLELDHSSGVRLAAEENG